MIDEAFGRGFDIGYEKAQEEMQRNLDDENKISYQEGREKAIDERASLLAFICKKYNISLLDMNSTVDEWERLKGVSK